jgi:4-hydroxy-tetrahydrodipicolinate synthase
MPRHSSYLPQGVIPAVLLPFKDDMSIDEEAFRVHLRDVSSTDGLSAISINAHSTEVASCTLDEQRRVLEITQDEVGDRLPVVHGIYADGSLEAARIAKMATEGGASALLVFPPAPLARGQYPEMAVAHFKRIADATDLPLIAFQFGLTTGLAYSGETLLRLADDVPTLRAIKDSCNSVTHHEWNIRNLQSLPRPVTVLTTHSAWLMSSLVLGCSGILSGSGSVVHALQVQIYRAVQEKNLTEAQRLNDLIYPTAKVFYDSPATDMHNRMKEALVMMGKLPSAVVRPPLVKLGEAEIERIRLAMIEAQLLDAAVCRSAA